MSDDTRAVEKALRAQLTTLRVIWLAMASSIPVMAAVLSLVPLEAADPESPIPLALGAVSIAEVGALFFLRKTLMGSLALVAPSDLRVDGALSGAALLEALEHAANRYRVGTMVGAACAEAIAVFGIVAAIVRGDPLLFWPFAGFGLLLLVIQFPRVAGVRSVMSDEGRKGLSRALGR